MVYGDNLDKGGGDGGHGDVYEGLDDEDDAPSDHDVEDDLKADVGDKKGVTACKQKNKKQKLSATQVNKSKKDGPDYDFDLLSNISSSTSTSSSSSSSSSTSGSSSPSSSSKDKDQVDQATSSHAPYVKSVPRRPEIVLPNGGLIRMQKTSFVAHCPHHTGCHTIWIPKLRYCT